MEYYVLVGDLVSSRSIPNRPQLGERIRTALSEMGKSGIADEIWLAPPVTTRGIDEFSAVFRRMPRPAFDVVVDLAMAIWPCRFRCAIGYGIIDVGLASRNAGTMDGPAFHHAADALERARRHRRTLALGIPACGSEITLVESLAQFHAVTMAGWSESEFAAVRARRYARCQTDAARVLGITQQAISDALRRAKFQVLTDAQNAIREWFASLPAEGH